MEGDCQGVCNSYCQFFLLFVKAYGACKKRHMVKMKWLPYHCLCVLQHITVFCMKRCV